MIKIYTGLKGFSVFLFFIAGTILCLSVLIWGITKAAELLSPLLTVISYLLIVVFLLGILPVTFFKDLRPSLSVYSMVMSHALGVTTWMMSFFFIIKTFGFLGMFFAFLFQFLAPIALVSALLQGSWRVAEHLSLWICFIYAMRFYSQWLLTLDFRNQKKSRIIDVDAVEIQKHSIS